MSFTLEFPPTAPSHTVILRSPELGNTISVDTHKVYRRLMGGEIKSVKAEDWPTQEIYAYKFIALTQILKDSFKTFLSVSAGLQIKITDHNGSIRVGYIITPVVEIVTARDFVYAGVECDDGDAHQYDMGFEFLKDIYFDSTGAENLARFNFVYEDDTQIAMEDTADFVLENS